MSETINKMSENKPEKVKKKRKRVRTKNTKALVLAQLEKLFCAGGLERNGKLKSIIRDSPLGYVDFTLIRDLFSLETDMLQPPALQALGQHSKVFEVSEDGKKVRQRPSVASSAECTIFVDNLPPEADETWLVENFEKFGTVARAEVPKPRSQPAGGSGVKNRGFGFVEFVSVTASQNAEKSFSNEASKDKANKLSSKQRKDEDSALKTPPKRKRQRNSESESDLLEAKKAKTVELNEENKSSPAKTEPKTSKQDCMGMDSDKAIAPIIKVSAERLLSPRLRKSVSIVEPTKKKRIRRKKRHQKQLRSVVDSRAKVKREKQMNSLMVLSLKRWKQLKEEYRGLQKANMHQAKILIKTHNKEEFLPKQMLQGLRGRDKIILKASHIVENSWNKLL